MQSAIQERVVDPAAVVLAAGSSIDLAAALEPIPSCSGPSAVVPPSSTVAAEDPFAVARTSLGSSSCWGSDLGPPSSVAVADTGAPLSGWPSAELGEAPG